MINIIEEQTTYRLNVNKTKFYVLAKQLFPEIGPMKKTEFVKYPYSRDYALNFLSGTYHHHLFLSLYGGDPMLSDTWSTYTADGTKETGWEYHEPTLNELNSLGMLEKVIKIRTEKE